MSSLDVHLHSFGLRHVPSLVAKTLGLVVHPGLQPEDALPILQREFAHLPCLSRQAKDTVRVSVSRLLIGNRNEVGDLW